jgi:hypothetical protein
VVVVKCKQKADHVIHNKTYALFPFVKEEGGGRSLNGDNRYVFEILAFWSELVYEYLDYL